MTDTSSAPDHRGQLRHLNNSLISGSFTLQEYDELLPFVVSPTSQSREDVAAAQPQQPSALRTPAAVSSTSNDHRSGVQRSVHFADDVSSPQPTEPSSQYQILAPAVVDFGSTGLQLRCPACGASNDTARGRRCYICRSHLTISQRSDAVPERRERARETWPDAAASVSSTGAFTMSESGQVVISGGLFSCVMQDTQTITTAEGSVCQVFVMCCTWHPYQAEGGNQQTEATWYVSQRFSNFEKLHKTLKKKFSRCVSVPLPPFPAKYHLTDRLEKRKQGLAIYMSRLLHLCASGPSARPVPELDEFLNASHQIQLFQSQRTSTAAASTVSTSLPVEHSRQAGTPTSVSSPFSRHESSIRPPAQSMASPMDATELAQAEGAVKLLAEAIRNAQGDVRRDRIVQHHLDMCVQLAPGLQRSADLDNPFASADLIPRAMQCEEDLQQAVTMYNDSLLAVSSMVSVQQQAQQVEPHIQAPQVSVRNVVPASAA